MVLNHLSLPTLDVQKDAKFFSDFFKANIISFNPNGSAYLRHSDLDIVLAPMAELIPFHPDFHFGLEFETKKEIEELYAHFKGAGVQLDTNIFNRHERGSRFFARTPGGLPIELNTREDAQEKFKIKKK